MSSIGQHRTVAPIMYTLGKRSRTVRVLEIASILGVTHQGASQIADKPGFPAPVGRDGPSRLWDRREITVWVKVWRREKPWR
jgi:hypothetical protein